MSGITDGAKDGLVGGLIYYLYLESLGITADISWGSAR